MKQPHEYVGVSITAKFLSVSFVCGERGARRLAEVKVPLEELDQPVLWAMLDRSVARALIARWSDVPLEADDGTPITILGD